jgi:hypothetical protein
MIDNFNKVKEIFKLNDMNDWEFHTCVVWIRKKDLDKTPDAGIIWSNNMQVRTFFISNENKLDKYEKIIKFMCDRLWARAYFSSCSHSYEKASLKMIGDLGRIIMDLNYPWIRWLVESSIMTSKVINKNWVIDIDEKDDNIVNDFKNLLWDKIQWILPTVQWYHIVTKPFDRCHAAQALNSYDKLPDIHKDNYCLLYCNL